MISKKFTLKSNQIRQIIRVKLIINKREIQERWRSIIGIINLETIFRIKQW